MNGQIDFAGVTPRRYFFSIAFVLGLLFAFISTEQDQNLPLSLLQWQLQTLLPMAILVSMHILLLRSSGFSKLSPWLALTISGVLGATLFVPIALLVDFLIETDAGEAPRAALFDEWTGLTPPIALCWIAINAPWILGYRLEMNDARSSVDNETIANDGAFDAGSGPPDFMILVDADVRGQILYLKAELHYLLVVTDLGKSLILYNLSDAVTQLSAEQGMMVHRSYWVSNAAVTEFIKKGRQGELVLTNGVSIPVSRGRLPEVMKNLNV